MFILLDNHALAEDGNKCDKNSDVEFCAENIRYSLEAFANRKKCE